MSDKRHRIGLEDLFVRTLLPQQDSPPTPDVAIVESSASLLVHEVMHASLWSPKRCDLMSDEELEIAVQRIRMENENAQSAFESFMTPSTSGDYQSGVPHVHMEGSGSGCCPSGVSRSSYETQASLTSGYDVRYNDQTDEITLERTMEHRYAAAASGSLDREPMNSSATHGHDSLEMQQLHARYLGAHLVDQPIYDNVYDDDEAARDADAMTWFVWRRSLDDLDDQALISPEAAPTVGFGGWQRAVVAPLNEISSVLSPSDAVSEEDAVRDRDHMGRAHQDWL